MDMRLSQLLIVGGALLALAHPVLSQEYEPRVQYGQPLEPVDRILHGAGQDPGAFLNYWNVMDEAEKPIVFMHYEALISIGTAWARNLKRSLRPYQDRMIVIQLGLELVNQTDAVVTGERDRDIEDLLDGIEALGLPVYVRIGYEFNGFDWNRYEPESYKAAFIYITDKIRERDLEIVTVWNYVPNPTQPTNFMAFYPGDEYVDWWSINYFEPSQIGNSLSTAYLDSAAVHERPVLIGESTPKDIGVLDGEADWNAWFEPFFALIASEPGIKMTGYINWDWGLYPQWSTWGDARLEQNEEVRRRFNDEMDEPLYAHSFSERAYREVLGYEETTPPPSPIVQGVSADRVELPVTLSWDAVEDASGIARYKVYNHGELLDYTAGNQVELIDGDNGDTLVITVTAVDRAGNEGDASEALTFTLDVPEVSGELIVNGQFDDGMEGWSLTEFVPSVSGLFAVDSTGLLDGSNSAHVTILQNSGTNWHLQLEQPLRIKENHRYAIAYTLRANRSTPIEVWLQEADAPFSGYIQRNIMLSTEPQTFQDTAFTPVDDDVFMRFMLGTSGLSEIWVDAVSVFDLGEFGTPTSAEESGIFPGEVPVLQPPYPNPVRSDLYVRFTMPVAEHVSIYMYDALGRRVATLYDGVAQRGENTLLWTPHAGASGVYFIRFLSNEFSLTQKAIVLR